MQTKQTEKVINSHSEKKGIHIKIAEGSMNPDQPAYTASVGKIFTSVIISMLSK